MDILGKIRRLQEERGWSENHLAEQAHLSQSTINSLYRKGNVPTIPTLEAICRAFGKKTKHGRPSGRPFFMGVQLCLNSVQMSLKRAVASSPTSLIDSPLRIASSGMTSRGLVI